MSRRYVALTAVLLAALLLAAASPTEAIRPIRCGQCGTVVDVDAIFYERDVAKAEPAIGTIIGVPLGTAAPSASGRQPKGGLVGHNADRANRRGGTTARRIELRMDRGGHRVLEVHGAFRIYRGDRVRVLSDRLVVLD